jgi:hypothetical protein
VPVPPIRSPVITIPIRSPIISRSIVSRTVVVAGAISGAIIRRTRHNHRNLRLRIAHRAKSSDQNDSENKEELSHNSVEQHFGRKGRILIHRRHCFSFSRKRALIERGPSQTQCDPSPPNNPPCPPFSPCSPCDLFLPTGANVESNSEPIPKDCQRRSGG